MFNKILHTVLIIFLVGFVFFLFCCANPNMGLFVDSRDGKTYKTVKIGNQTWMAENLNYKTEDGSHCFQCKKYGRLYEWHAALSACPEGWHLPTKDEWKNFLSGRNARYLKSGDEWYNDNSYDRYDFSILPAGLYDDGQLNNRGSFAQFWSADVNEGPYFVPGDNTQWSIIDVNHDAAVSIRCIQGEIFEDDANETDVADETFEPKQETSVHVNANEGEFIDPRDNLSYKTMKIGNQEWFAEDLRYNAIYSDHGRNYDWISAMLSCPDGWHLPNNEDWRTLSQELVHSSNDSSYDDSSYNCEKESESCDDSYRYIRGNETYDEFVVSLLAAQDHYDPFFSYWSSTPTGRSLESFFSWSFRGNYNVSISKEPTSFTEFLPVRCVRGSVSSPLKEKAEKLNELRNPKYDESKIIHDDRDGQSYKAMSIGNTYWLTENMNYKTKNSVCYDNDPSNCEKYGMLYDYDGALKACPAGWRLPNAIDWATLKNGEEIGYFTFFDYLSTNSKEREKILGFSILEAGYYTDYGLGSDHFDGLNKDAAFWVYNKKNPKGSVYNVKGEWHPMGKVSVRCVKKKSDDEKKYGMLKDSRDGKKYKTVKIGSRIWMAENLNYETPDGGSRCYNDKASLCTKYGRLYTKDAAGKACPTGWHLPRLEEYSILYDALHIDKHTSLRATKGWGNKERQNGTDDFGFSALPGGYYYKNFEEFSGVGEWASFGTADGSFSIFNGVMLPPGDKYDGMNSIRCVQDY